MADSKHNTNYCDAIERSGHAHVSGPPRTSIPSAAGLLINMPMAMAATQPVATQPAATHFAPTQLAAPTAMPLLSTMSVRPGQMSYFTGTPNFYSQSN